MNWKYLVLVAIVVLVVLQFFYSLAFHATARAAIMKAKATQAACTNGKPLERETVRYMLHAYISKTGTSAGLVAQMMTLLVLVLFFVAILLTLQDMRGGRRMDSPYVVLAVSLFIASLVLGILMSYQFGGGIGKLRMGGFSGIPEYKEYAERYKKISEWIQTNKGTQKAETPKELEEQQKASSGFDELGLRDIIIDRIQRFKDLDSIDKATVIYETSDGRELMGYLIYDNDSSDFLSIYQAIANSTVASGKKPSDNVAKVLGEGTPPYFTYPYNNNAADKMQRMLKVAAWLHLIPFLIVFFILFHVLYQRTSLFYLIVGFLILFVVLGTWNIYQNRIDII